MVRFFVLIAIATLVVSCSGVEKMPTPESDTRSSGDTTHIPKNQSSFLMSLREWQNLPADEREPGYLFVRCAGLYLGFLTYIGPRGLGKKMTEYYTSAIPMFSMQAIYARFEHRGGTAEEYYGQVERNKKLIAEIYRSRMRRNYATTGQAFATDQLMVSDLETCVEVNKQLLKQLAP